MKGTPARRWFPVRRWNYNPANWWSPVSFAEGRLGKEDAMQPPRLTYHVIKRSWLGISIRVMQFRTALDLYAIPGLIPRLKEILGGTMIRRVS